MILTSTQTRPDGSIIKTYEDLCVRDNKGRTVGVLINLQPETAQGFSWNGGALRDGKDYGSSTAGTSNTCPPCRTAEERDAAIAKYLKRVEAAAWKKFPPTLERVPYTEG